MATKENISGVEKKDGQDDVLGELEEITPDHPLAPEINRIIEEADKDCSGDVELETDSASRGFFDDL